MDAVTRPPRHPSRHKEGGRFILSTGDQCGRDTPDENLYAMIETVKEYGVYDRAHGTLPGLPPPSGAGVRRNKARR